MHRHVVAFALIALLPCAACADSAVTESATATFPDPPAVTELANTSDTAFALASEILAAVEAGEEARLLQLRVDAAEFRHLVWDKLPSSRPERRLTWEYVWSDLDQKSRAALRGTIARHRGRGYRLLRVEFAGETTEYGTFRVHRDARCVVDDQDGNIQVLDLFGSVIEMEGRYKAFSFVVD